ncbi:hypothetical protein UFOVP996_46 [uncultured Caudovirales phage]|uniref:Uncharacterized protein n=1 Tax=uncultured Caudovirales phage TaxID=2100421 RepID=A0A6J5Q360_9CAUD|nr:hypothetical protein UFOVP996_46 [uncultured Caudovirales phage]
MRKPIGLSVPMHIPIETPEEKEIFNEFEKRSSVKQMGITHPSREAQLFAEVAILSELVRVLSDRVNKLEKKQ